MKLAPTLAACTLALTTIAAQAQTFPTKSISLFMPSPPGTLLDLPGRQIAAHIAQKNGWTIVPENRSGGNFVPILNAMTLAPNDGHAVAMIVASMTVLPVTMNIDFWKEMTPLTRMSIFHHVLVANTAQPYASMVEMIKYAKANPGKVSWASTSLGGMTHLVGEMLKRDQGLDMVVIPYNRQFMPDIIGNQVPVGLTADSDAIANANPAMRVLVVFGEKRHPKINAPTTGELGIMKGAEVDTFIGFAVKAGTQRDLQQRWFTEIQGALRTPAVAEVLRKFGMEPVTDDTPEAFQRSIAQQTAQWVKIIKEGNLKF
jgi:tripartite-type tricarboxylate transporter receptor subunit TctC